MMTSHVNKKTDWRRVRVIASFVLLCVAMVLAIYSSNVRVDLQIIGDPLIFVIWWLVNERSMVKLEPLGLRGLMLQRRTLLRRFEAWIANIFASPQIPTWAIAMFGMSILYSQDRLALLRWGWTETGAEVWGIFVVLGAWLIAVRRPRALLTLLLEFAIIVYGVVTWLDWTAGGLPRTALWSLLIGLFAMGTVAALFNRLHQVAVNQVETNDYVIRIGAELNEKEAALNKLEADYAAQADYKRRYHQLRTALALVANRDQ